MHLMRRKIVCTSDPLDLRSSSLRVYVSGLFTLLFPLGISTKYTLEWDLHFRKEGLGLVCQFDGLE